MHLRVGYRSWTVWPPCWQNQRPSSSLNTIPAAWRVCFICIIDRITLDSSLNGLRSLKKKMYSLNVYRNSQDVRGRQHGALRRVNKSLVWQPSWGKIRKALSEWKLTCCGKQSSFVVFSLLSSWPLSSRTQSTFWTNTSSSAWSRQTATSRTVMSLRIVCDADTLSWAVLTVYWCLVPKGEGCVALRAAQFCHTEFQITLTHHGEKTGTLTGGIQLHTSECKPTEKLYGESGNQPRTYLLNAFYFSSCSINPYFTLLSDFIKVEKDDTVTSKGKGSDANKYDFFPLVVTSKYLKHDFQVWHFLSSGWQVFRHPNTWYY